MNKDLEPEFPALIHAPGNPFEPLLVPIPDFGVFVERMNVHYSPGPDHWRPVDRVIDASGQIYSITWGGPNDETGGDYFITPLGQTCSAEEMVQLLKEHHRYLERKPTKYLNDISTVDPANVIRESIAYVSALPRCPPILRPRDRRFLLIVATILIGTLVVAMLWRK